MNIQRSWKSEFVKRVRRVTGTMVQTSERNGQNKHIEMGIRIKLQGQPRARLLRRDKRDGKKSKRKGCQNVEEIQRVFIH